jgi:hypothetical protein
LDAIKLFLERDTIAIFILLRSIGVSWILHFRLSPLGVVAMLLSIKRSRKLAIGR